MSARPVLLAAPEEQSDAFSYTVEIGLEPRLKPPTKAGSWARHWGQCLHNHDNGHNPSSKQRRAGTLACHSTSTCQRRHTSMPFHVNMRTTEVEATGRTALPAFSALPLSARLAHPDLKTAEKAQTAQYHAPPCAHARQSRRSQREQGSPYFRPWYSSNLSSPSRCSILAKSAAPTPTMMMERGKLDA